MAVADAPWSAPSTWTANGLPATSPPGAGDRVYVPSGRTVTYDHSSTAPIAWIRVDGTLMWATSANTLLHVDTIGVTTVTGVSTGRLEIGTEQAPVAADKNAKIVFVAQNPLTVSNDPTLLGRGLISMGSVRIVGAEKTSFVPVTAAAAPFQNAVTLATAPTGWAAGDKVVIAGTRWVADTIGGPPHYIPPYNDTQDEEHTIAGISNTALTLTTNLAKTHQVPSGFEYHVANLTRNVELRTDPAIIQSGNNQERGHVMFMSNPDVVVKYASFIQLGRTDKKIDIDDVSAGGTNPRGRYSVHLHKTGETSTTDPQVIGCAVDDSPGWGFVAHGSTFVFEDNASFDVVGAHFVTEDGNETGTCVNNIAIRASGGKLNATATGWLHIKEGRDTDDLAHGGHGFWFQGRNVHVEGNRATGCHDAAFVYFHRGATTEQLTILESMGLFRPHYLGLSKRLGPTAFFTIDDMPIWKNIDNMGYASRRGLHVIKANPDQEHDLRNTFVKFRAWECPSGMELEYTREYTFLDLKLLGNAESQSQWEDGILFGNWADGMNIFDSEIHEYRTPISMTTVFEGSPDITRINFVDTTLSTLQGGTPSTQINNVIFATKTLTSAYDPAKHVALASTSLTPNTINFAPNANTVLTLDPDHNKDFTLYGTRTDSLGADSEFAVTWAAPKIVTMLASGHYTENGKNYVVVWDYIVDRITNQAKLLIYPLEIPSNYTTGIGPSLGPLPPETWFWGWVSPPSTELPAWHSPLARTIYGL